MISDFTRRIPVVDCTRNSLIYLCDSRMMGMAEVLSFEFDDENSIKDYWLSYKEKNYSGQMLDKKYSCPEIAKTL